MVFGCYRFAERDADGPVECVRLPAPEEDYEDVPGVERY
jgi:hypothetical protein